MSMEYMVGTPMKRVMASFALACLCDAAYSM